MKSLVRLLAIVLLASFAAPAIAAEFAGPGFWTGFLDGTFCIFKLLLSPFVELSLVSAQLDNWSYALGYYLGVLSFAVAAGATGYSEASQQGDIGWG